MHKIVFATENPGKLNEIKKFADHFGYEVSSPSQAGLDPIEVEETGTTYEENARLKVEAYLGQELSKSLIICGDDSGIEIDALNGEPGIHTRRWLGYRMSDDEIIGYALGRLATETNRIAMFKSTVAFSVNGGQASVVTGDMRGAISDKPFKTSRQEGFPFRSLFLVDAETPVPLWEFDELPFEQRNGLYSHREKAFIKLFNHLDEIL